MSRERFTYGALIFFVAVLAVGCGGAGSTPTAPDIRTPTAVAVATSTATATPAGATATPDNGGNPTSTPTTPPVATAAPTATLPPATPTTVAGAPIVTITANMTSCHPKSASSPCPVAMTATIQAGTGASPFTYVWSGCAGGTAAGATCNVNALGNNSATVIVTDSLNRAAQANKTVQGTNTDPTGSASGGGSCHPKPGVPCTKAVSSSGSDGDADTLTYSWAGCASGSATGSTCSIASIGTVTATVTICDGWTCIQSSVNSTGTNSNAVCTASGGGSCHPSGGSPFTCATAVSVSCSDADGDPVTISWSGCASGSSASSSCTVTGIGSFSATATGNDGWANSPSSVGSTGTDTAPVEGLQADPIYASGTQQTVGFGYSDADGDPFESCSFTCKDGNGIDCCNIINCRTDTFGGQPGHIIYSGANSGTDGHCNLKLIAKNHWGQFVQNTAFHN